MSARPRESTGAMLAFAVLCLLSCTIDVVVASGVADTSKSRFAAVRTLAPGAVRWTDGFWAERFEMCRTRSLPAMWEIMRGHRYKPYLEHFLIAAGEMEGRYRGAQWNDGDFYKFLEAASAVLAVAPDDKLAAILDESIGAIGRAQRADGYIHTPVLIAHRNGDLSVQPFADRHNFEMYNMGHLITAACVHYRATRKEDLLAIAKKTADFLCETFRDPSPELARNSVCPSHYMGIVELYRTTGEPRYLELAEQFLRMRTIAAGVGDDNQDRIPFVEQREAVGHAVRANYLYAGAADLLLETGAAELRTPLEAIWQNVVEKKLYITGGCGALYDGASPYGSPQQSEITRTHQAYGHNYELPNTTAHNETCANIGNLLWNWRMFLATGEAKYIDVLERSLYNSVLSGVSLEGTDYFYVNPLRNTEPLPAELRWSRTRVPFVTSYCCPPNVVRTVAEVSALAYARTEDTLWINLFGSSKLATELNGEPLELVQETKYPWDGRVRITLGSCPQSAFALHLRIPGWTDEATISINGQPARADARPGTYAKLLRRWRAGDVVELSLAMVPRLVEAHPLVEETRNQVALQRGPLVYCLESCDLPEDVAIENVVVPVDAPLVARHDNQLLEGVTVIDAEVIVRPESDWSGTLYRTVESGNERRTRVSFIPYYAWSNRGPSEMTVWLPRK